jgi:hypothetical protein
MKIGLEKEFFVMQGNKCLIVPTGMPFDDSGVLTEARSAPFEKPEDAVFSLQADIYRLQKQAEKLNLQLSDVPFQKIDRDTRLAASRKFAKGLTKYQNLYNYKHHKNGSNETPAGIHISFTNPKHIYAKDNSKIEFNAIFDYVTVFKYLDQQFTEEIKAAKRNPGFYELKGDGRIEYRSLPANTNLDKIIEVLKNIPLTD